MTGALFANRGAVLSPCGIYRYRLWRVWDAALPRMAFVMLNPSTADAQADDPTIRKCVGFAQRLGAGGIDVVNLFAFRATNPRALDVAPFPVGRNNDVHIRWVADAARLAGSSVVCAWGSNARNSARAAQVLENLRHWRAPIRALHINGDGTPAHPLRLPYSCKLISLE